MRRAATFYMHLLSRYPITTNIGTGFTIASVGDVIAQSLEQPQQSIKLDIERILDMGLVRAVVIAPFISFWYPFLNRNFSSVISRIIVDQCVGSPTVICLVFLANTKLRGGDVKSGFEKIKRDGMSAWGIGLSYWPLVHSITFGVLPLHHQPLFAHFASVPWNAVLSHYANRRDNKSRSHKD